MVHYKHLLVVSTHKSKCLCLWLNLLLENLCVCVTSGERSSRVRISFTLVCFRKERDIVA